MLVDGVILLHLVKGQVIREGRDVLLVDGLAEERAHFPNHGGQVPLHLLVGDETNVGLVP